MKSLVARACVSASLLSAAVMADEVALTRALSFAQWYHFAFLLVSVAMLGAACAGVLRAIRPTAAPWPLLPALSASALFLLQPVMLWLIPLEPTRLADDPLQLLDAPLLVASLAAPLFSVGLALTDLLGNPKLPSRVIYGADLLGAAVGGAAGLLLLPVLGSTGILPFSGALCLAAGALMAEHRSVRLGLGVGAALICGLSTVATPVLMPHVTHTKVVGNLPAERVLKDPRHVDFRGEDGVARVEVLRTPEGPRILMDAGTAVSRAPNLPPHWRTLPPVEDELAEPFRRARGGSVLIVGSGGGWEVFRALSHGVARVVAVEVSGVTVDYVRHHAPAEVREMFRDPRVLLVHDEARSYLERSDERFDAIVMIHTISNAAAASGAMALAEDPLFTRESMATLRAHLTEQGTLFLTRPDAQLSAMARLLQGALPEGDSGAITLWSFPGHGGFLSALLYSAAGGAPVPPPPGGVVVPLPERVPGPLPTDDRPYFHARRTLGSLTFSDVVAVLRGGRDGVRGAESESRAARMALEELPNALVLALLAVLVALVGLLAMLGASAHGVEPLPLGTRLGAILVGVAFMLAELATVSRLTVLLGAPSISFAVVVGCLLVGAGASSVVSSRIHVPFLQQPRGACALAAVGVALAAVVVPAVASALMPAQPTPRVAGAALLVVALGSSLGLAFPALLRQALGHSGASGVAWTWALNGAASVLGGALSVLLSVEMGLQWTLITAAAGYALAALLARSHPASA
ncbi:MAG: hypothetical protein AB2A00_38960 [Myxococcota bacterium]